ncbi:MAG: hypothetical protein N4A65_10780 [Cohaesibacter sp.]|jgi:hypothetical protein|nr:hypothetical protein [Cohaesibacter sp.]
MAFNFQQKHPNRPHNVHYIKVEFEQLPKFYNLSTHPSAAWFLIGLGGFFLLMSLPGLFAVLSTLTEGIDYEGFLVIAPFLAIGWWMVSGGRKWLGQRHYLLFRPQGVRIVRHDRKQGLRRTFVPYTDFSHIEQGQATRARNNFGKITYQIIKLCHENEDWSVPLYVETRVPAPNKLAQDYAQQLGLPLRKSDRLA